MNINLISLYFLFKIIFIFLILIFAFSQIFLAIRLLKLNTGKISLKEFLGEKEYLKLKNKRE